MTHALILLTDGALFGALAYLGTMFARIVLAGAQSFDDGPAPATPRVAAIVAVAALAGIITGARTAPLPELGMACLLAVALAAVCYADIRWGLVPDVFTLAPLGAVLAGDVLLHSWAGPIAALLVAAPFALAALMSRGRGMGWGDVKLVALGAATIGAAPALIGFAGASFAAVAVAVVRGRRHAPIAFAPYLVAAIGTIAAVHGVA